MLHFSVVYLDVCAICNHTIEIGYMTLSFHRTNRNVTSCVVTRGQSSQSDYCYNFGQSLSPNTFPSFNPVWDSSVWSGPRRQDSSECCCVLCKHSTCYHRWKKSPSACLLLSVTWCWQDWALSWWEISRQWSQLPCFCFLFSPGTLFACSRTTACLDICGKQIEMKVTIVKNDWCLFFWSGREGTPLGVHRKTFTHANARNLRHSWTPVAIYSHGWKRNVKGRAVYFGHVVVQVKACNVFQGAGVVSARTVMWGRCKGQSTLKL